MASTFPILFLVALALLALVIGALVIGVVVVLVLRGTRRSAVAASAAPSDASAAAPRVAANAPGARIGSLQPSPSETCAPVVPAP